MRSLLRLGSTLLLLVCGVLNAAASTCSTLVTFNAALLSIVPKYEQREQLIHQALLESNADVICLQEYWIENHVERLIDTTSGFGYKYHYSALHYGVGQLRKPIRTLLDHYRDLWVVRSACSRWDYFYFTFFIGGCIKAKGCLPAFEKSTIEGTLCALDACGDKFASPLIRSNCINCIFAFSTGLGVGDEPCKHNPANRRNRFNRPGLVLLSRKAIHSARYVPFHQHEAAIDHGFIEAEVDDVGKVVCTHLTAELNNISLEYNKVYADYKQQRLAEIEILLKSEFGPSILLGDLNTGLMGENSDVVVDRSDEHYQKFLDAGYRSNYVETIQKCTWCASNEFTASSTSYLIDNILLRGSHLTAQNSSRIFDSRASNGLYLSDHFAVQTTYCET